MRSNLLKVEIKIGNSGNQPPAKRSKLTSHVKNVSKGHHYNDENNVNKNGDDGHNKSNLV